MTSTARSWACPRCDVERADVEVDSFPGSTAGAIAQDPDEFVHHLPTCPNCGTTDAPFRRDRRLSRDEVFRLAHAAAEARAAVIAHDPCPVCAGHGCRPCRYTGLASR